MNKCQLITVKSGGIHLREILQIITLPSVTETDFNVNYINSIQNLGDNELKYTDKFKFIQKLLVLPLTALL